MSAEILVMCPGCGLPQKARTACTRCGATLPESPVPLSDVSAPSTPDVSPAAVISLGGGRHLAIDDDALQLGEGNAAQRVSLASIQRASLERSWNKPSAVVVVVGVLSAAIVPLWPLRLLALLVAAAGVWSLTRDRRYVLRLEPRQGEPIRVLLGTGTRGGARGVTAQSAWVLASEELRRRGVEVIE